MNDVLKTSKRQQYSFHAGYRLTHHRHFSMVMQSPHFTWSCSYFKLFGSIQTQPWMRLGCVIAKKYVKKAHQRIALKRIIREAFRHHQHRLCHLSTAQAIDVVFLIRQKTAHAILSEELSKFFAWVSTSMTIQKLWHTPTKSQ
jgi:ribonuclease P protein component